MSEKSLLLKFASINSKPTAETFPELPTCLMWTRFFVALAYGTWLGLSGSSNGGSGIVMGLNLITFVPFMYASGYLMSDMDSYGPSLLWHGVPNAVCLLVLIWMYFYTLEHEDEEKKIVSVLFGALNSAASAATEGTPLEVDVPIAEESEF